jgi:hypothetical protein
VLRTNSALIDIRDALTAAFVSFKSNRSQRALKLFIGKSREVDLSSGL